MDKKTSDLDTLLARQEAHLSLLESNDKSAKTTEALSFIKLGTKLLDLMTKSSRYRKVQEVFIRKEVEYCAKTRAGKKEFEIGWTDDFSRQNLFVVSLFVVAKGDPFLHFTFVCYKDILGKKHEACIAGGRFSQEIYPISNAEIEAIYVDVLEQIRARNEKKIQRLENSSPLVLEDS